MRVLVAGRDSRRVETGRVPARPVRLMPGARICSWFADVVVLNVEGGYG